MIQRMLRMPFITACTSIRVTSGANLLRSRHLTGNAPIAQRLRPITVSRWYATEPEQQKTPEEESKVIEDAKQPSSETDDVAKKELEARNKEIIELKDRYLRSVADFRNLQERTKREVQSAKDFAIQQFAKDLMESVDNLDRALAMVPQEKLSATENSEDLKDLVNLYDGLKMTERILMQTLKKHGLVRFDPSVDGEKFNPNEHEATFMAPMEGKEDGTVILTQVKGFKLNNRVVRAAKVGVVKK